MKDTNTPEKKEPLSPETKTATQLIAIIDSFRKQHGKSTYITAIKKDLSELKELKDPKKAKELVQNILTKTNSRGNNLFGIASQNYPGIAIALLNFCTKHKEFIGTETIKDMFLNADNYGFNALIHSARNQPMAVKELLLFVAEYKELIGIETIQKMLIQTTKEGWNTLIIVAGYQPEAAQELLNFIESHKDLIGTENIQKMMMQANIFGVNALIFAIKTQPKTAKELLQFIHENKELIGSETIQKMLAQTTKEGWNALSIIIENKPKLLDSLLPLYLIKNDTIDKLLNEALKARPVQDALFKLMQTHPNEVLTNLKPFDFDNASNSKRNKLTQFVFEQLLEIKSFNERTQTIANDNPALILSPEFMKLLTSHPSPCPDTVFKTSLEAYKTELKSRKEKGVTRLKLFGYYTTSQKQLAFDAFTLAIENKEDLSELPKKYKELTNGRLGELFQVALKRSLSVKTINTDSSTGLAY